MKNVKKLIEKIMDKYNVGKRPLSIVLGFGEITITRYVNGDSVPDDETIMFLESIEKNPSEYLGYLERNHNEISTIAYNKSKIATKKYISSNESDEMLNEVSNYIINNCDGITNLKLQKLLYYCQLFSYVYFDKPLFTKNVEAWQHGPVYSDVYYKYKTFGDKELPKQNIENSLDKDIKEMIDKVIDDFGVFSGSVLCYFTHSEKPWKNNYVEFAQQKIDNDDLIEMSKQIKEKNKCENVDFVACYVDAMLDNYRRRKKGENEK